jgi:hypothetical protein
VPLAADDHISSDDFKSFLGLALPYPEGDYIDTIAYDNNTPFRDRSISVQLIIDETGRVQDLTCHPDSTDYVNPVSDRLKDIQFVLTPGRKTDFPFIVPIYLSVRSLTDNRIVAAVEFPIKPDLTTDSIMLNDLFAANRISPPGIDFLDQIFYKVDAEREKYDYTTVTAHVTLDSLGEPIDIDFPIPGQDKMTHYAFMALRNAKFSAPAMKNTPFASGFFVTIRFFDNIRYPFSPHVIEDTLKKPLITEDHFMTVYYHPNDISLPPLPRKHPGGYIHSGKYGRMSLGIAEAHISIDTAGQVSRVSVISASPRLRDIIAPTVKLLTWYPARDNQNRTQPFSGRIFLNFKGNSRIDYSLDWLDGRR